MKNNGHEKAPIAPTIEAHESNAVSYQENNVMMNTTTVVDMRKFVEARNGEVFTTSQHVADAFGKLHKDVLRKIEGLDCSPEFTERNFTLSEYVDGSGRRLPQWSMTKDGFMFLVMGFTGKKAASIKEGYIAAFNWMAEQLHLSSKALVNTAVEQALGVDGARKLSNIMRCRVAKMDAEHQRSATAKLSSALHARFGVPRLELISASQMDSACNFVASYAIEGEYLGKESAVPQRPLNIHYPLSFLSDRRPDMLTPRAHGSAWLDVKLDDIRENRMSPCEMIISELDRAGYEVAAAWWEIRTLKNKTEQLKSMIRGISNVMTDPHRYAVKVGGAA